MIQSHNPLDFSPNELASVCVCWKCGGKLIRNCGKRKYYKQDGTNSEYIQEFLKCLKSKCMSVKYRDVEGAIVETLKLISDLDDKELNKFINETIKEKNTKKGSDSKQKLLEQITQKEKELSSRMEFIFDKYEKGIYTDEMFIQRKLAIEKEREELDKSKKELEGLSDLEEIKPLDNIRNDLKSIVGHYTHLSDKEAKNKLLRSVFEYVEVEILEKGKGRTPARFEIIPVLRYNFQVGSNSYEYDLYLTCKKHIKKRRSYLIASSYNNSASNL